MQLQMILRRSLLAGFASSGAPAAFAGEAAAGLSLGLGGAATAAARGLAAPGATGSSALGILCSPRRLMERSRKILLPIEHANINDARSLCQLSSTTLSRTAAVGQFPIRASSGLAAPLVPCFALPMGHKNSRTRVACPTQEASP